MDPHEAYHYYRYLHNLQMAQNQDSEQHNHPNYQQYPHPTPTLNQSTDNATDYSYPQNLQGRAPPMRLHLPPPPVFATDPSPSNEYPNQYGPSTLIFSPLRDYPPHTNNAPNTAPQHPYPQTITPSGYPGSVPPSPFPTYAPAGQPSTPGYLQQQQQQLPQHAPPSQQYSSHSRPQLSPYYRTYGANPLTSSSNGSNESAPMSEYFPPYDNGQPAQQQQSQHYQQLQNSQGYQQDQVYQQDQGYQQDKGYQQEQGQQQGQQLHPFISPPILSPSWQSVPQSTSRQPPVRPELTSTGESSQSAGSGNAHGPKTNRQQFTACGACRHRRVKCDLKLRQEEASIMEAEERANRGHGPVRTVPDSKKEPIVCTNCKDRHMKCVDEYAPMKAAKQLRRGKRISEVEVKYGKNAVELATTVAPIEETTARSSGIPELSPEFFESPFFRRFQVQRPILDPTDFVGRYLSYAQPCAANLGPEGALLCHVLYAWAVSYGVDEHGQLDIPEGGGEPMGNISLLDPGKDEVKREADRQARFAKMRVAVDIILQEIDACGILRKPTWDGVRVLLLLLPLTEGISSPVERLAMYESALSQVFMLCSYGALGYDGKAAGTSGVNGGSDQGSGRDLNIVRIRTYWYAFVHEGITTGLKGGRLLLDGDDLETIQDSLSNRALVSASQNFRSVSKMAVAPINLALACRLINRALTGPVAKRRNAVNAAHVKEAWEALEGCWEEFESIRNTSPGQYASVDEVTRFVDGWKIFLFEAQNVIRSNLEERLAKLANTQITASISDPGAMPQQEALDSQILNVMHLLEIAKSKCDIQTRQIMNIVRTHLGTRFFEWDASLVRDGTYYAAMLLAKNNGSDDDIACCVQALNELRWAHAKAWSRSADLRKEWAIRSAHSSTEQSIMGLDGQSQSLLNALQSMTANPPNYMAGMTQNRPSPVARSLNRSQTDSSLSNSPYNSSPSLISPVYDPTIGPPLPYGRQASPHPQQQYMVQSSQQPGSGEYWTTSSSMPPPSSVGPSDYNRQQSYEVQSFPSQSLHQQIPPYQTQHQTMGYQQTQDMGYIPQQQQGQGQAQTPTGRYVFQPDGSQIYIPYSQE